MPRRSILYCLEPIGLGTATVESLTSYMVRLSFEQSIAVKDLVTSHLMVGFSRDYFHSPRGTRSSSWARASRAINGVGVWARDAVSSLQSLVQRPDLHFLTMLPCADVIPPRGLLKDSREWCSACYREWHDNGSPIHDPLLWFLRPVRMCARHRKELEKTCPRCRRSIQPLSSQMVPGFCPHCGSPLWVTDGGEPPSRRLDARYRLWQQWIAGQLGELLVEIVGGGRQPQKEAIREFFRDCADLVFAGKSSETARLVQVSRKTMCEWIAGSQLPALENLLVSCYCFDVSVAGVLLGTAKPPSLARVRMPLWIGPRKPCRPPRVLDKDAIQHHLRDVVDANYLFPPSMIDVSRFLDIDASHLTRLFPGLCKQISQRYLSHASLLRREASGRTMASVRDAVRDLHRDGVYPTYDAVSSSLSHPWVMRCTDVRDTWKAALRELDPEYTVAAVQSAGWEGDSVSSTPEAHRTPS